MKSVIVGTAGHIDHGKTSLVKALTGIDADRLEEEKRRGITIDLGFAHLEVLAAEEPGAVSGTTPLKPRPGLNGAPSGLFSNSQVSGTERRELSSTEAGAPSSEAASEESSSEKNGLRLGFVDVPGHERFVRNMLAGVGGIDLVLLVIAADESIKPQTREHFDICQLLSVRRGITVITKADAVDADTLDVVKLEVEEFLRGSFLDPNRSSADDTDTAGTPAGGRIVDRPRAPIVAVSSLTGAGLEELKRELARIAAEVPARDANALARLPIDRVFSMKGFGTVVTGTLVAGTVKKDEELEVFPSGRRVRVRGVQVHGAQAEQAVAGQRTALNLVGATTEELARGMMLAPPETFKATSRVDVSLNLLASAKPLKDRARVHLHAFTLETVAQVALYREKQIRPGGTAYAQLRLAEPGLLLPGDRFILRQFSPVITIGGGVVLDASSDSRRKAFNHKGHEGGAKFAKKDSSPQSHGGTEKGFGLSEAKTLNHKGHEEHEGGVASRDSSPRSHGDTEKGSGLSEAKALNHKGHEEHEAGAKGAKEKPSEGMRSAPVAGRKEAVAAFLEIQEKGSEAAIVRARIARRAQDGLSLAELTAETGWRKEKLQKVLSEPLAKGDVLKLGEQYVHAAPVEALKLLAISNVEDFHKVNPLVPGISKEELRKSVHARPDVFAGLLDILVREKKFTLAADLVHLPGRGVVMKDEEAESKKIIEQAFATAGLQVPALKDVLAGLKIDRARAQKIMTLLLRDKVLLKISEELVFHHSSIAELRAKLAALKAKAAPGAVVKVEIGQFKDLTGVTRKYAIPLLEYFDRERVTKRVGDARVIL